MADTWYSDTPPPSWRPRGFGDWARVAWRGLLIGTVTFGGLALLLQVRLVERPLFGLRRPWTPHITRGVCWTALRLFGLRLVRVGTPLDRPGAMVANHSSWLDIFVLNASTTLYFVSKSEVAGWPGIGWLARATGTLFIRRDRREASAQTDMFKARLMAGHRLLFFPEGTSTDNQRVLEFKPTLFQAFFADGLKDSQRIQPVSVRYIAPPGTDPRFYGWWGDMTFEANLLVMLAWRNHGAVHVTYHAPVAIRDFDGRKTLAAHLRRVVRDGYEVSAGAR